MKIGIIGVGKVGVSLGQYLIRNANAANIIGIYDTSEDAAKKGANLLKTVRFGNLKDLVKISDILFLTVTDDAIKTVWEQIADFDIREKIVVHCSGALSSDVFTGIAQKGAFGYSVHPAMTISHHLAVEELQRAPFTIEGATQRLDVLVDLFEKMGNPVQILTAENKIRYHAAAVFASNFIVALAGISMKLLADCGFNEQQQRIFLPLMQVSIDNIVANGLVSALTGPVERGDIATIEKHLADLVGNERALYDLLSRKIFDVAKQKNPQKNYDELETVLSKK